MLTTYRRHLKSCPHRVDGRAYRRCKCPIWVDGTIKGEEIRKSLKSRNWEQCQDIVRKWEATASAPDADAPLPISQACSRFETDAIARGLSEATVYKYRLLFQQLKVFADSKGIQLLRGLDVDVLREFRASWKDGSMSALKKLERLACFFRFSLESGWIGTNPVKAVKKPKVTEPPTMPFTQEQMVSILKACDVYPDNYGRTGQANARRLGAFVLLLRYSGMRIGDGVALPVDRIQGNKLFLYTQKTNVPVYCPLPPFVVEALDRVDRTTAAYFFWTGDSTLKSAVGDWQRSLRKLFKLAGVPDGHAHRFRDTFAVELLLAGVPLERVSVLLGHRSVKVTEKHYSPWVRARTRAT